MTKKRKRKIVLIIIVVILLLRYVSGPVYRNYNPYRYDIEEYYDYILVDGVQYNLSSKYVDRELNFLLPNIPEVKGRFNKIYEYAVAFSGHHIIYQLDESDEVIKLYTRGFGTTYYTKDGLDFGNMDILYYQLDFGKKSERYYISVNKRFVYEDNCESNVFKLPVFHDSVGIESNFNEKKAGAIKFYYKNGISLKLDIYIIQSEYYLSVYNSKVSGCHEFYRIPKEFLE